MHRPGVDRRPGRTFDRFVGVQRALCLFAVCAAQRSAGRPRPPPNRSLTS